MPEIETTGMESGGTPTPSATSESTGASTLTQEQKEYFDPNKHVPRSEFTKLRQRDAEERQKAQAEFQQRQDALAAREQQLVQAALQIQQRMQGGQQQNDPYGRLREAPYVAGQDLVEIVEQLRNKDIGGITQAIRQRDQALGMMYKQLTELKSHLDAIQNKGRESEFEGRLHKVRSELGLPDAPWAQEFLKDVYLSHEGADLADEFPTLARTRLEELRKALRALDKEAAAKARQTPVLASGGSATPGSPLKDDTYKTPRQRTEELFDAFLKPENG